MYTFFAFIWLSNIIFAFSFLGLFSCWQIRDDIYMTYSEFSSADIWSLTEL